MAFVTENMTVQGICLVIMSFALLCMLGALCYVTLPALRRPRFNAQQFAYEHSFQWPKMFPALIQQRLHRHLPKLLALECWDPQDAVADSTFFLDFLRTLPPKDYAVVKSSLVIPHLREFIGSYEVIDKLLQVPLKNLHSYACDFPAFQAVLGAPIIIERCRNTQDLGLLYLISSLNVTTHANILTSLAEPNAWRYDTTLTHHEIVALLLRGQRQFELRTKI